MVVATDAPAAEELLPGMPPRRMNAVTCLYFAAPEPPVRGPYLVLNGEGRGPVNNLAVMSEVAPSYAPEGQALVSVSVLEPAGDAETLEARVREQLTEWFGGGVAKWRHLRTYAIRECAAGPATRVVRGSAPAGAPVPGPLRLWRLPGERLHRGGHGVGTPGGRSPAEGPWTALTEPKSEPIPLALRERDGVRVSVTRVGSWRPRWPCCRGRRWCTCTRRASSSGRRSTARCGGALVEGAGGHGPTRLLPKTRGRAVGRRAGGSAVRGLAGGAVGDCAAASRTCSASR